MKTALVTGGSSGIGRSTAAALKNAGFAVYEFSRRNVPQDGIKHISVDVTDENAVQKAVGEILSEAGEARYRSQLCWLRHLWRGGVHTA